MGYEMVLLIRSIYQGVVFLEYVEWFCKGGLDVFRFGW